MGDMTGRNLPSGESWGQHHSHRISELFQVSGTHPALNPQWTYCPEYNTDTAGMASGAKTEATRYIERVHVPLSKS